MEALLASLAYSCAFGSVALATAAGTPLMAQRIRQYLDQRAQDAAVELGDMFVNLSQHRLRMLHGLAPVVAGVGLWMLSGLWPLGLLGFGVGLLIPRMALRQMRRSRAGRFQKQFVDGLLLLSSSLRAGLSMAQSFAVIAEEMPPPISEEFALLLKEIRMGVNVDEALVHLKLRMPSDDTTLFVTAVLVARETGGDVTAVFTKLVETVRERHRLKERIKTLTFMAKMQGVIMGALPFIFATSVYSMDKNHFSYFFADPLGKLLLIMVVTFWVVGLLLFIRFGRSPL